MHIVRKIPAKPISYAPGKRNLKSVKAIVIHYTGNIGDTAKNNAVYFNTGNTRVAGAHIFIDADGKIYKSINFNKIAYSVGGFYSSSNGAAQYYNKLNNSNTISIELCNLTGQATKKQIESTKYMIKKIRKKCPNATKIVRHWDINGKNCPAPFAGKNNKLWKKFKMEVENK